MSNSLFSNERSCWICGSPYIHRHHVYAGARRKISEKEGCWVYLCPAHHNMSNHGVHFDKELDLQIKQECQRRWEKANEGRSFLDVFRCNYL